MIGDDQVFSIERALYAIEGFKALTLARAANHDAALDLVEVECMCGLAHGEPGEVSGVDGAGDALLLEKAEEGRHFRAGKPVARLADCDAAQHARSKAAAALLILDPH